MVETRSIHPAVASRELGLIHPTLMVWVVLQAYPMMVRVIPRGYPMLTTILDLCDRLDPGSERLMHRLLGCPRQGHRRPMGPGLGVPEGHSSRNAVSHGVRGCPMV